MFFVHGHEFTSYRDAEIFCISHGIHCEEIEEDAEG